MGGTWVLLSLCFLLLLPLPSRAADSLVQGQSIKDGQTLLSPNKTFELGFFSPGKSRNRYVGIWYHGVSPLTTVWVANRDDPLPNTSGTFGVSAEGGNLVLLDGARKPIWSANSSAVNASARLLDTGNLILDSSVDPIPWQSFDHPTDTFIPGMKILQDTDTGKSRLFTSWKSPDDPGTGKFSLGLDPQGSSQIYMWEGSSVRWRSGQWNGGAFVGTRMRSLFVYGFKLTLDDGAKKRYYTFSTFNSSLYRFVLQPDGVENATILVQDSKRWGPMWSEPMVQCELYNHCGRNSMCVGDDKEGKCSCLLGYGASGEGKVCERKTRWRCERNGTGEADVFVKVPSLKLPDLGDWASTTADAVSCARLCAENCTCRAYAYMDGIGCLIWGRDLVDVHQWSGLNTGEMYLKVAASDVERSKRKTGVIAVVVTLVGILILASVVLLWWKCKSKVQDVLKEKLKKQPSISLSDFQADSHGLSCASDASGKSSELPIYQFNTIAVATQSFRASNKLGQGGFGDVYKGVFPWGQEVAVKRLSRSSGQGLEEFKNEAILIAKLQHRNLVRLMGCCVEREEKILVYEYLPNKSLDAFIFDDTKRQLLDWNMRFSIMEGIARGLLYLHRDSRLRIVHRDLKASNILLDEEMNPKISDFGMARIFGANQNQENTTRVVGTFGYMSPEYAMEGLFSVKSDVYSFGVLMLEIISGRKNSSFSKSSERATNLVGYAWGLWNEDRAMELADRAMGNSIASHQVLRCIQVGLLCVQDKAADRPLMSSVVMMLGSDTPTLAMPLKPTFTLVGGHIDADADSALQLDYIFTSSDVTMTEIVG